MLVSNSEIKRIKSLQQKKFRDESGLFIVEGEKMVDELMHSGWKVENVYRRDDIGIQGDLQITGVNFSVTQFAL